MLRAVQEAYEFPVTGDGDAGSIGAGQLRKPLLPQLQQRRTKSRIFQVDACIYRVEPNGRNSSAKVHRREQSTTCLRILEAAHCGASLGVFAGTGFVMRSVPAASRRSGCPGSAISDAGPARRLWFAKTLADFEINDIAALPPLFCYNS
jgi:hypothetical protein